MLRAKDRSAHLIAQYMPAMAKPIFVALREFNLETVKIPDTASEPAVSALKLDYWKTQISAKGAKIEPLSVLEGNVHNKFLLTMVDTQLARLAKMPLRTVKDMQKYGEGVYSQMNYATFDVLCKTWPNTGEYFAKNPDLDELATTVLAHIGQANGIAALLKGFKFYASKHNYLNLPIKMLLDAQISEQQVLDAVDRPQTAASNVPGLKDVVFEVATHANDHLLTASSLLEQFRQETRAKVPYALVLPAMTACPITLYLQHLEKCDFNLLAPSSGDWKLPWRTWRAYKTRNI